MKAMKLHPFTSGRIASVVATGVSVAFCLGCGDTADQVVVAETAPATSPDRSSSQVDPRAAARDALLNRSIVDYLSSPLWSRIAVEQLVTAADRVCSHLAFGDTRSANTFVSEHFAATAGESEEFVLASANSRCPDQLPDP